jgi:hypothetical protein
MYGKSFTEPEENETLRPVASDAKRSMVGLKYETMLSP